MATTVELNWPDCVNVRDLGGMSVGNGGRISLRRLVRADTLSRLTPAGQRALIEYGIGTIVDLRTPRETAAAPYSLMQAGGIPGLPHYLNIPLEDRSHPEMRAVDEAPTRRLAYGLMLRYFSGNVAEIVRAVARTEPGCVLIHCQAGKDRTGIMVSLLLAVAGVPLSLIAADYAISEGNLWPLYRQLVDQAYGDPDKLAALPPEPRASPHTISGMFADLTKAYGSVADYLMQAGVDEGDLDRVRRRLVETNWRTQP